jgi:hypothetical protein
MFLTMGGKGKGNVKRVTDSPNVPKKLLHRCTAHVPSDGCNQGDPLGASFKLHPQKSTILLPKIYHLYNTCKRGYDLAPARILPQCRLPCAPARFAIGFPPCVADLDVGCWMSRFPRNPRVLYVASGCVLALLTFLLGSAGRLALLVVSGSDQFRQPSAEIGVHLGANPRS